MDMALTSTSMVLGMAARHGVHGEADRSGCSTTPSLTATSWASPTRVIGHVGGDHLVAPHDLEVDVQDRVANRVALDLPGHGQVGLPVHLAASAGR